MIEALRNLGEYAKERDTKKGDDLDELIENPNENRNYNKVIFLKFKINDKVVFDGLDMEEFSKDKLRNYLYKKGTPKGGNYTPTLLYTGDIAKMLKNINEPIKKIDDNNFKLLAEYLDNKENIENLKSIVEKFLSKNKSKKEGYIFSVKINDNYLDKFDKVIEQLKSKNDTKYYEKYGVISKSDDKICFCCREKKEVYGFVNTFNFTTFDKEGMITGGFKQENTWKNYPICRDCSILLEKGKSYLKNNFSASFAGLNYFVIPKLIYESTPEENKKIFETMEKKIKLSLSEENRKILTRIEEDIKKILTRIEEDIKKILTRIEKDINNNISLNFMIYKEEKSAFNILLYIEDVLPSRIKKIIDAKLKVEKDLLFNNDQNRLYFNFENIRIFFPNNSFDGNWDREFLECLNSIFTGKQIEYQFIIKKFIEKIRKVQNEGNYSIVLNSLLFLNFLIEMNLLKRKNLKEEKEMIEKKEENEIYLKFFEERKKVFDSDFKKATFLVGVLVQKLLNLPEQRNNKPFYSRLNGLKIDEKILKRIFVEVQNKLNEYKKNYYQKLETLISEFLTVADFSQATENEVSYFFVLGMNLSNNFRFKEEEKEEKIEEE